MSRALFAACLMVVAACGGDGGGGTTGPAPTASLTGIIREAGTGTPISGATVTAGSVSATTAADGRFTLQNVPIGATVTVSVNAAGYDSYTQTIAIQTGSNSHDVSLSRKTIFELGDKLLYLPPGISTYRGILFDLPGFTADSRPWIRGDHADTRPGWGDIAEFRRLAFLFAEQQQFAIMGSNTFAGGSANDPSTLDGIISQVTSFAALTGHPELAQAPLLLFGHSLGGCVAYGLTLRHANRVIGLVTQKGSCHSWLVDAGAEFVPAYLVIGKDDPGGGITNITTLFERGRTEGAPWSVIIFPEEDHARTNQFDLIFNWLNTVVSLRLPPVTTTGQPVQLRPIDTTTGWLANRSTGAIARYACYNDDRLLASWFPTEQTARDWYSVVFGGSATVTAC